MSTIESRMQQLGVNLPEVSAPAANYVPWRDGGGLVVISGQLPMKDGKPEGIGKLGREFSVEQGQQIAQLCTLNLLAHLKAACGGDLNRARCVRLGIFVNATEDFTQHPQVANGASDLVVGVLGDKGKHARAAIGVGSLPLGVAVEVEGIFEVA